MGREVWLAIACGVLAACGQTSHSDAPELPPEPPEVAPRWLALSSRERLLVVRFDDVTRPEELVLSAAADGEAVEPNQIYWSPTGEHVAFLTSSAGGAPSLWLASASDGFARRRVVLPDSPASSWGPAASWRALFWMGPNTFALRVPSEDGVAFYRASVDTLSPELLGAYTNEPGELGSAASNVLSAASRFGFLFSTGSRSQADLYYAGESGSPRRLGSALSATGDAEHYSAAELAWAPDGQSASFWSWAVSEVDSLAGISGQIRQYSVADAAPPELSLEPDAEPRIGHVHLPLNLYVDAHPHGNLTFSEEVGGRALAPEGGAVAYTLHHQFTPNSYRVLLGVPSPMAPFFDTTSLDGGLGYSLPPQFGFLDASTLFYSELIPASDSTAEPQVRCVLWRAGKKRELSVDRYAPFTFRVLPGTQTLYFVRENVARRAEVFSVDLADPAARAEPVPLTGSVVLDSVLPQGHSFGPGYGMFGGSDAGSALLVSTSTAAECRYLGHQCETARWVVELAANREVIQLEARWLYASLGWAVDGSGLLAADSKGLSFVPSAGYRGSFPLSAQVGTMIVPDRWPAP